MTTVITGATGFIGSRLLPLLLDSGRDVVTLGRDDPGTQRARLVRAMEAAGRVPDLRALRCVQADITLQGLGMPPGAFAAIAREAQELWHLAADVKLVRPLDELRATNVAGLANLLDLAAATDVGCRLYVFGTAYVAGRRREGRIAETDLTDAHGFEVPYEQSKYEAEVLIREWSARHARPVTVIRPSVLATDRPVPAGAPRHSLWYTGRTTTLVMRAVYALGLHREPVRIRCPDDATLNVLPVEYAVRAMLAAADDGGVAEGVRVWHLTHPAGVSSRLLLHAMFDAYEWFTFEPVEDLRDPNLAERLLEVKYDGLIQHIRHRRDYDRSGLLAAAGPIPDPPEVDAAYLAAALGYRAPQPVA